MFSFHGTRQNSFALLGGLCIKNRIAQARPSADVLQRFRGIEKRTELVRPGCQAEFINKVRWRVNVEKSCESFSQIYAVDAVSLRQRFSRLCRSPPWRQPALDSRLLKPNRGEPDGSLGSATDSAQPR